MKLRIPILQIAAQVLVVSAVAQTAVNQTASPAVSVVLARPSAPVQVNPLLLGSQNQYFSVPVRQKIRDENLLQNWRGMPVKLLRYPGGTWGDHYNWDNPSGSYYAVGNAKTIITPAEFIENCLAIGAEPIFQANANTKGSDSSKINPTKIEDIREGAKRAAGWVKEANKVNKWNVKYWEIGNEVWIWLSPEEYAKYVVEYSKAMKAVDPSIKIIACGLASKVGPFGAPWLNFPDDPNWKPRLDVINEPDAWNAALLKHAKGYFDYLAPHIYFESGDEEEISTLRRYMTTNSKILDGDKLRDQLSWIERMGGGVKLAVTEWSTNFRQSLPVRKTKPEALYFYSLGNGLNIALFFGKMAEAANKIDMAVLHDLDDIQTLWYWQKKELATRGPLVHPAFLAMQLWGNHLGTWMMTAKGSGGAMMDVDGKKYPSTFIYGSEDQKHVYFVALNLNPNASQEIGLSADRSIALTEDGICTWMAGEDLASANWQSWEDAAPRAVDLKTEPLKSVKGVWNLKMPAHSMVGLKIRKQ